jgi:hypothetical protein
MVFDFIFDFRVCPQNHLEKVIQIKRENAATFRLSKTLIVRGNVYLFQHQFSEALCYYQEAAKISEQYG